MNNVLFCTNIVRISNIFAYVFDARKGRLLTADVLVLRGQVGSNLRHTFPFAVMIFEQREVKYLLIRSFVYSTVRSSRQPNYTNPIRLEFLLFSLSFSLCDQCPLQCCLLIFFFGLILRKQISRSTFTHQNDVFHLLYNSHYIRSVVRFSFSF